MIQAQSRWHWPAVGLVIGALIGGSIAYQEWPTTATSAQGRQGVTADLRAETPTLSALGREMRKVADAVEPSVVYITVKARASAERLSAGPRGFNPAPPEEFFRNLPPEFRRFFGGPDPFDAPEPEAAPRREDDRFREFNVPRTIGAGSGWVWDDRGHIITNNHVVENADEIEVVFFDESRAAATIVGTDPKTDVAVLKVDHSSLVPARRAAEGVAQGDLVFAFGSPLRYRFSMSQGVVSGVGRQVGVTGQDGYEKFIQTDAAINPGNSGGPLTNIHGEVVGMNTAIATGTGFFAGIGFAIPMDVVEPTVLAILEDGKVSRGFIGILIRDDAELLETFDVDHGAVVAGLVEGGPAADAGLKVGDVVLRIDGQEVKDASDLRWIVAGRNPGDKVKLEVLRDGKRENLTMTLGEQPDSRQSARADRPRRPGESRESAADQPSELIQKLGLTRVRTFDESLAERYSLEFTPGVLIEDVRSGSLVESKGVQPGMVITHVMSDEVKSVEDLNRLVEQHGKDGAAVRLQLRDRTGQTQFAVVRLPS